MPVHYIPLTSLKKWKNNEVITDVFLGILANFPEQRFFCKEPLKDSFFLAKALKLGKKQPLTVP